MTPAQEAAARTCLSECTRHIANGEHEGTIRSVFNSHLRAIAGDPLPWWADEHFKRTEAALVAMRAGRLVTGRADNLVGLTAIEYEKDLTVAATRAHGLDQVREYMAGLLNRGVPAANVRGVLSDTVRWLAFDVDAIAPAAVVGSIAGADLTLRPLTSIDCSAADLAAARQMHQFLEQHLGRDGGQFLSAETLHEMLGTTSVAGAAFVADARAVVDAAFLANPAYAQMMQTLWASFVSFVGTPATANAFDRQAYAHELYLLTLAKLIAANVLAGTALISTRPALQAILDGSHFTAVGLTNLVEYDYFGWLTKHPHVAPLILLAEKIQLALKAFNFSYLVPHDLFGPLVGQMAERTQRLLLGQEPTPKWLVEQMVDKVDALVPAEPTRRYIDPCCGSGAFVVEVVTRRAREPGFAALPREARGQALCQAITGFDIDPLAVVLSKVSWLIAAKPHLQPLNSAFPTSIPVYHADSLFAMTPLAPNVAANAHGDFRLVLDTHRLTLPRFLADPAHQALFDEYAQGVYAVAQNCAAHGTNPDAATVAIVLAGAETASLTPLSAAERVEAETFGLAFATALTTLERAGRNGLWLHMLKNGYRPAMVEGRFQAVVTNFPWLTLSKLANNPYKDTLQGLTAEFNLQPSASSAPHLELATIFFLHAARHYLTADGVVAGLLPSTVIQGEQHAPFRAHRFVAPPSALALHVNEVWDVAKEAFKTNVSAVVVAKKGAAPATLTGAFSSEAGLVPHPLFLSTLNNRNAWTRVNLGTTGFTHYEANEGADVMPRTVWFHEIDLLPGPGGTTVASIQPLVPGASPRSYLIAQPKVAKNFRATPRVVPEKWVFKVLTSAHVVQFATNEPDPALLPLERRAGTANRLVATTNAMLSTSRPALDHFTAVFAELSAAWPTEAPVDIAKAYKRLNFRSKLSRQCFSATTRLVVYGASGAYPCAAVMRLTPQLAANLVIDQTVYWIAVEDADEADYMVGMMNSVTLANVIRPFQPTGKKGARHLHTLPVQVLEPWDPASATHRAVVTQTRALQSELATAAVADARLHAAMTVPTASIDRRRQVIREALTRLPSYADYQAACLAVLPS